MTGTVAARLSAQPFFAALTDSQRGELAEDGTAVTFTAGERLFDEGGVADMFWLIEQGGIALDMRVPGRGDQIVETLGAVARWPPPRSRSTPPRYAVAVTPIRPSDTPCCARSRRSSPNDCRRPGSACWTCMPPRPR
jgi:hypothetical protein